MIQFFPNDRVVMNIGSITIYWYGLLYVVAFGVAYGLMGRLQKYRGFTLNRSELLELLTWGAVGVIVGGRLGYVLLYEPAYYFAHPADIFSLSHGGMSSHGGFVGVTLALWLWSKFSPDKGRQRGVSRGNDFIRLFDVIVVPAALGIALGRLGNVINHELYLTPLAQLVGVGVPLVIAGICYWHLRQRGMAGTTAGLFLVLWSLARFGEEFLRELQWPLGDGVLTWGQLYTLPLLVVGLYLLKDEAGFHR